MNVEIAERLARRRREAGYSQENLAERLGVTRQAVSKWERSESSPDTDNLIGLAKLYGVSLDELLNVDPSLEDDVAFEAADKARARNTEPQESTEQNNSKQQNDQRQDAQAQNKAAENFSLIDDDGSYVNINWYDGVHVKDANTGEEVHVGWKGIHIKDGGSQPTTQANSNHKDFSNAHMFCRENHSHVTGKYMTWMKFPIYLLAILAYLILGFFAPSIVTTVGSISPWLYGIFLIAIIPTYHMVVHAIARKSFIRFIQGFYPFACVVFFLWMWLFNAQPHPTWVVFLTIPIIEWICRSIRNGQRRRRKATVEVKTDEN